MTKDEQLVSLMRSCAGEVFAARPGAKTWAYGWCSPEYRRSSQAAIPGSDGPVGLTQSGIIRLEELQRAFWRIGSVRERWNEEEFWGYLTEAVARTATATDPDATARRWIDGLVRARPAWTVLSVANVAWDGAPFLGRGLCFGKYGPDLRGAVDALKPPTFNGAWPQQGGDGDGTEVRSYGSAWFAPDEKVVFACRTIGQAAMAFDEAQTHFTELVGLSMMLGATDADLRGLAQSNTYRPGVRGLVLHRPAIEEHLREGAGHELIGEPLVFRDLSLGWTVHWFADDLLPLDQLVERLDTRWGVEQTMTSKGPIHERLRVASRWFLEAHHSNTPTDAVVALGVCLDAIVGAKSGLPGRVLTERFALLEPDPARRESRAKDFQDAYKVRSAAVHGAQGQDLSHGELRRLANEVRWAAVRILEMHAAWAPQSERELTATFEALRWGMKSWSSMTRDVTH